MPARAPSQAALGLAVREARTRRGWSQEELAHASGLHPTYLSGVERGRRNPSWASIARISEALAMRASELIQLAERLDRKVDPSA